MDYRREFEEGQQFREFLEVADATPELWRGIYERVHVPAELAERAARWKEQRRLLVLSEDWCGDAVNSVPFIARLAEEAGLELRIIARDQYPHVMDAHLTRGARSIPVVIALDPDYRELGWWGPRPAELQAWFSETGRAMPSPERYRHIRRWYAQDRGRSIMREVVELLEGQQKGRQVA